MTKLAVDEQIHTLQLFRTSFTLALLFTLLVWETTAPFFPLFTNRNRDRCRHGVRNLFFGLANSLLTSLAVVALWGVAARFANHHHLGLLNWLSPSRPARLFLGIILFDCWMYWWHRLNHRLDFFWRFHRTHHSDPKMDVTTAYRFHFGEIIFSSLFRAPIIVLLGMNLPELVVYETLMFAVVQLHHANVALPRRLDRLLRCFIVTPSIHKVHHSRLQPETDSNYSSLFSWWDRAFKTLNLRDPATIQYGLVQFDSPNQQTISGLIKTPLGESRADDKSNPA